MAKLTVYLTVSVLALTISGIAAEVQDWSHVSENKQKEYAYGQSARTKWLEKLPADSQVALDVPYVADAVLKGSLPGSTQTLDLYVPPGAGPFPLIVWIHGGAWKGGNKEQQGTELAARWLPEGFAVASLNYRFVFDAQFPGMFQDAVDAIHFLREHAARYRLNPAKVGVIGMSAGAHIAGVAATADGHPAYRNNKQPVQAAVLLCGFYDMASGFSFNPRDDFANLYPDKKPDLEIAKNMSPVCLIHDGIPPILLVHGDLDLKIAPPEQTQRFYDALQKAGKPVKLTNYPDYDHNLWKPDVLNEALMFFKEHLSSGR
ncbi:MAG: alpha/beta hydrolase [Verrucomicrobiales bacterium]|jgi:acetyl esterase/lipase|nr:alpha/beta hydrolase [Verrucomicrobiales bacterium]